MGDAKEHIDAHIAVELEGRSRGGDWLASIAESSEGNANDVAPELPTSSIEESSIVTVELVYATLRSVLEQAKNEFKVLSDSDAIHKIVENVRNYRGHDDIDGTLACQLHQLYMAYFTNRPDVCRFGKPSQIIGVLAHKANHAKSCRLWPDGSWVSRHKPKAEWLSQAESSNVGGMSALHYKRALWHLGYGPIPAPTEESLHAIWRALYDPAAAAFLHIQSDAERYAVVSYVQRQDCQGREPPATWVREVDSVLTALVEMNVITKKAVWFDKLASRQYEDSQKWWGAAATMQFLFNPVIVQLPRLSEHASFVRPSEARFSIWGSAEADECYQSFLQHSKHCTQCLASSYPLRWALDADFVLPISSLRTWPRVEHTLGAYGLGLYTSDATYAALAATLTCAYGMFAALCKNNRGLYKELLAPGFLASTHIQEDDSIIMAWVHISCSDWPGQVQYRLGPGLTEMASCVMDLHELFCKLQTPKLLSLQLSKVQNAPARDLRSQFQHQKPEFEILESGLFYPATMLRSGTDDIAQDAIDVPIMARYNANDAHSIHGDFSWMSEVAFAAVQVFWAIANMRRNLEITMRGENKSISNAQYLAARRHALTTLVHTKAAQAPCYAWEDKFVAAILLSSPQVFLDAIRFWRNKKEGGHMLGQLKKALASAGVLLAETDHDEEIEWEPNTLIVVLGMQWSRTVNRIVPRPTVTSTYHPVHYQEFQRITPLDNGGGVLKGFAGYFLGNLPLRAINALPFRTRSGQKAAHVTDWVYRTLQHNALLDSNIVVVRHEWRGSPEQQIGQCWHCQRLRSAGLETPGRNQEPTSLLLPDYQVPNVRWGFGSFDPLNFALLLDPNYCFGLAPDSVAVMLDHRPPGHDNPSPTLQASGLVHFTILASSYVRACITCHAILIEEWDNAHGVRRNQVLRAVWTILPMDPAHIIDRVKALLGSVRET